jgi:hypothetical protein
MMPKPAVKLFTKLLILTFLFVLTLLAAKGAFGAVGNPKFHGDSIGVPMYQTNPNMYMEGKVIDATPVGRGINLRIQPRGTYGLFSESVLLCDLDDTIRAFEGKGNVVVLTYERKAHHTIEGIGCHDIRFVDQISGGSNENLN